VGYGDTEVSLITPPGFYKASHTFRIGLSKEIKDNEEYAAFSRSLIVRSNSRMSA
jgi:hypothetical protein